MRAWTWVPLLGLVENVEELGWRSGEEGICEEIDGGMEEEEEEWEKS